jgi:hypothetical protein
MSRQAIIAKLMGSKLHLHKSLNFESLGIPQDETARTLYVSSEISAAVSFPFPDTPEGERLGEFRAWLDNFIEGSELTVAEDPDQKPPDAMLARVHPVEKEFWSIRVTLPETTPGIRSLGAFSDTDEFVALTWEKRELIAGQFNQEVEFAMQAWKDFFGIVPPHQGNSPNDYLTICIPV